MTTLDDIICISSVDTVETINVEMDFKRFKPELSKPVVEDCPTKVIFTNLLTKSTSYHI